MLTRRRLVGTAFALVFVLPLTLAYVVEGGTTDWRSAGRTSAGLAPQPETHPEAIVQVYAARAVNWRGVFGVHTWLATKPAGADAYSVHHVLGWRARRGGDAVASGVDIPDRQWFGRTPELIGELRGPAAETAIPRILAAIDEYPHRREYRLWPGPNSNTFIAWVGRRVPELGMHLPATAIGKDFLGTWRLVDRAPSGTGWQVSAFGLAGVTAARVEGLELNLLGLNVGVDFARPALKLPGLGRIGVSTLPAAEQPYDRDTQLGS